MGKITGIPLIIDNVASVCNDDVAPEGRPEVLVVIQGLSLCLQAHLLSPVEMQQERSGLWVLYVIVGLVPRQFGKASYGLIIFSLY